MMGNLYSLAFFDKNIFIRKIFFETEKKIMDKFFLDFYHIHFFKCKIAYLGSF